MFRHDIHCEHCQAGYDIQLVPAENFKLPTMPNTLADLPDHNNTDWLCPKCGVWNLTSDKDYANL